MATEATYAYDQIITALRRAGSDGLDKVELAQETGLDTEELREGLAGLMGEENVAVPERVGERAGRFVLLREDGEFPVPGETPAVAETARRPGDDGGRSGNLARAQITIDVMFDPGDEGDVDVEAVKGGRTLTEEAAAVLSKTWPALEVGAKLGGVEVFGAPRRVWPR